MSGPIVRTGTTPEFWKNYDSIFGKGKKKSPTIGERLAAVEKKVDSISKKSSKAEAKPAKKATKKAAKKAAKKK